jgi:hypothetical protein
MIICWEWNYLYSTTTTQKLFTGLRDMASVGAMNVLGTAPYEESINICQDAKRKPVGHDELTITGLIFGTWNISIGI